MSHGPLAAHKLTVCFLPGHQECPPDFPSPPACPSGALRNTTQSPCSQRPPTLEGSTPKGGVLGTMLGSCLPSSDELDLETKTNWSPGSVPDLGCDLGEFSPHPLSLTLLVYNSGMTILDSRGCHEDEISETIKHWKLLGARQLPPLPLQGCLLHKGKHGLGRARGRPPAPGARRPGWAPA